MNIHKYNRIYLASLLFALVACEDMRDYESLPQPGVTEEDEILFQANKAHVLTRSGNEQKTYFDAYTLFRMYAVESGKTDAWSNTANHIENVYDVVASASAQGNGAIDFRAINQGRVGKYRGRTIDIYGLTWDKVADPLPDPATNQFLPEALEAAPTATTYDPETRAPLVDVQLQEGELPDLMWGAKRGNSGGQSQYIDLPFEHTVSKITFRAVCQGLSIADGEYVTLHKVTLLGDRLYGSAQLNVSDGKYYNHGNIVTDGMVFYDGTSQGEELHVVKDAPAQTVPGQRLVFPINATADAPLNVKVEFTMPGETTPISVTYPIDNINFQPNYEYSFTLTFMDDNNHLVIYAPEVYDWIDTPLRPGGNDDDDALGKVVTFGGTTWMDRNLGAKSADPINNWDQARGAYYQFARNIPYYFDREAWIERVNSVAKIDDADLNGRPQLSYNSQRQGVGYFYTFNQNGERVYSSINKNDNWRFCTADNLAINPGEPKDYSFVATASDGSTAWLLNGGGVNSEDTRYDTYWQNTQTQPCPKGWKMPTGDDFRSFLPNPTTNNGTINADQTAGTSWTRDGFYAVLNNGGEDRIFGRMKVWDDDEQVPTVYLMKNRRSDESYIIRIRLLAVKDASGKPVPTLTSPNGVKQYFEIFRYATSQVTGNTFANARGQAMSEAEFRAKYTNEFWKTPVEKMYFGTYGHLGAALNGDQTGLYLDGEGSFLKTSNHEGNGTSQVAYMRSTWDGIGVKVRTSKSPGQQIRCVKDLDAY